ncbi:hypothetical protein GFK82_00497 [Candidatus Steffania adelgidicola]|nr:hypothetical protein GFK82_00497 [Candidatus Steffania adelgidicola]
MSKCLKISKLVQVMMFYCKKYQVYKRILKFQRTIIVSTMQLCKSQSSNICIPDICLNIIRLCNFYNVRLSITIKGALGVFEMIICFIQSMVKGINRN